MTEVKPKHQYFLKVDIAFETPTKVFAYIGHQYHAGEGDEKYKLQLKVESETEGECIEAVFDYAAALRDALTQMIDERAEQNSLGG
jgi:hypothetical protein